MAAQTNLGSSLLPIWRSDDENHLIAGLEHSGTTLLDFIIGGGAEAVAVGEVSSFINSEARANFLSKFEAFEDAHLCFLWQAAQRLQCLVCRSPVRGRKPFQQSRNALYESHGER
jgi:hypothetical protein